MAKMLNMRTLLPYAILEDRVESAGQSFYFYRFYPPNMSIMTDREKDIEIEKLRLCFENANRAIHVFTVEKVEDLSKNKAFFQSKTLPEYGEYTEQIVGQLSSIEASDEQANSLQRACYFIITVKKKEEERMFREAMDLNGLKYKRVEKEELVTLFRNFYLKEFFTFDLMVFDTSMEERYDSRTKKQKGDGHEKSKHHAAGSKP